MQKFFIQHSSQQPLKGAFRTVLRLFLSPPASNFLRQLFTAVGRPGLRERPPGESHASNAMRHRLPIEMFRKNSSSDSPRKLRSRCEELFFFLRGTHSARNSSRNKVSKTCSKDTHPDPPSGLSYAPPEKKTNNEKIKSPGWVPLQAVAKPPRGLYKLPAPRTQQGIGTSSTSPIALSST